MKLLLRSMLFVLAAGVLLATLTGESGQGQEKEKKKTKTFTGVVVKAEADRLSIKTAEKKKKDEVVSPAKEMSFKLTDATKVVAAPLDKGDEPTPAKVSDLKAGLTVNVAADEGNVAVRVVILPVKKKQTDK